MSYDVDYADYEFEREYTAQQEWHIASYERKLSAHPDCRDPDHPGCANCCGDSENEENEGGE